MNTLLIDRHEGYATLTLNRPEKLNALNAQVLHELEQALTPLRHDDRVHALIITGSGTKAFAAGADIAELTTLDYESGLKFAETGQRVYAMIEHFGKPVVAAINGYALGGGCELALACHLRFAAARAKLGLPEVSIGAIPCYGGTQRLARLVGQAKALELALSGVHISAQEALSVGLVNAVYDDHDVLPMTEQFVRTLLTKSQTAVRAVLRSVLAANSSNTVAEGYRAEAEAFAALAGKGDFSEGVQAFLEKRSPRFGHQQSGHQQSGRQQAL